VLPELPPVDTPWIVTGKLEQMLRPLATLREQQAVAVSAYRTAHYQC
jgi:hypothetical protein